MTEIWVVDTSSIIEVRRKVPRPQQKVVFAQLTTLVNDGLLVYPIQVVDELERFYDSTIEDRACEWAVANKKLATRFGSDFMQLKAILEHPQVKFVLDPDKVGVEEADPYVLSLACHLQNNYSVRVLVEETKDRPTKLSMNTACGHLRLIALRMEAFLREKGIWP